jgi:hypothetical protein
MAIYHRMHVLAIAIASGAALALGSCSAGNPLNPANQASSSTPVPVVVVTATPVPTIAPTPVPTTAPPQTLGTPVLTTAGDTYLVIAYKPRVSSNNPYNTPPPGGNFAAADVKECAGQNGTKNASYLDWSLGLADDSQVPGTDPSLVNVPGAAFPGNESLNPGSCVSGWVEFDVPSGGGAAAKIAPANSDFFWGSWLKVGLVCHISRSNRLISSNTS